VTRPERLALLLLFASLTSVAAELTPLIQQQHIGVLVAGAEFPGTLNKELASGLTNRILLRVALLKDSRVLRQAGVEIAIRYDLWDENYGATTTVDGVVIDTRTRLSSDEVHSMLAAIRLPRLFAIGDAGGATGVALRAEILLNPVERERLEAIKKWVADNSTYVPLESSGTPPGALSGTTMSNAIFNRIFEQYASGSDVAAVWQKTLESRPFNPGAPADERK
jgi:hypothetical protein